MTTLGKTPMALVFAGIIVVQALRGQAIDTESIEQKWGLAYQRDVVLGAFSIDKWIPLIAELAQGEADVALDATHFVSLLLLQDKIPARNVSVDLLPVVARLRIAAENGGNYDLARCAARVEWLGRVRISDNAKEIEAIVSAEIDPTADDVFYAARVAPDLLLRNDLDVAERVIGKAAEASRSWSELHDEFAAGLRKITLARRLAAARSPGERCTIVESWMSDNVQKLTATASEALMGQWLLRHFTSFGVRDAERVLRRAMANESLQYLVRFEAQELLLDNGLLAERERTLWVVE